MTRRDEDLTELIAGYIYEYLRMPYDAKRDNLTFNQILGETFLFNLEMTDMNSIYGNYSKHFDNADFMKMTPEEEKSEQMLLEALIGPLDDNERLMLDRYKHEDMYQGILRNLKERGYRFTANTVIDIGAETKKEFENFRKIDQGASVEHIYAEEYMEGDPSPKKLPDEIEKEYGDGVSYLFDKNAKYDAVEYKSQKPNSDFYLAHNVNYNDFVIGFDTEEECSAFLQKANQVRSLKAAVYTSPGTNTTTYTGPKLHIDIKRTADNTRPLLQLLVKEGYMNRAECVTFEEALKERSPQRSKAH